MKRRSRRRLSKVQREDLAALTAMKDSDIDLTDMPEVLTWSGAEVGRFYRKKKASIRVRGKRERKQLR
jgi:hypothetical protein